MFHEKTKNIQLNTFKIELPNVTSVEIDKFLSKNNIKFSDINYKFLKITKGMQTCVNNIANFNCSFTHLSREIKIHFSKFHHLFLYSAFSILNFTPFRLNLLLELTNVLIDYEEFYNSLLFSLFLLKKYNLTLNYVSISNFVEMLKFRRLLDEKEFISIIDFISSPFSTNNFIAFSNKPPVKWMSVSRFNNKKCKNANDTEEEEDDEEEEEEEAPDSSSDDNDENLEDFYSSDENLIEEEEEEESCKEEEEISIKIIYKNKLEQILDEITRLKKDSKETVIQMKLKNTRV